jgi:hypothetical protein
MQRRRILKRFALAFQHGVTSGIGNLANECFFIFTYPFNIHPFSASYPNENTFTPLVPKHRKVKPGKIRF